jgi:hypothetical protein
VSGFGLGGVLVVGQTILATTSTGELVLVAPNPSAYTELARFRALSGSKCWNTPAISNGRIYVRSTREGVCLEVAPTRPRLTLQYALTPDRAFRLSISNEDGSPLASNRVANIAVSATTNLSIPPGQWARLSNALVLTNGHLEMDDPESRTRPRRFYRAEEQP